MKKYNLSNIMKKAWEIKKEDPRNIFSLCLKMAWKEAKERKETMKSIKEMTIEELKELRSQIDTEIKAREPKKELVLYTHDCKDSANYHLGKYKHWAKAVTAVDTTKTNGFAFSGDFLKVRNEYKLLVGTIIVEVCDTDITCYRLVPEGKEKLYTGDTRSMSSFIEDVATLF